ncbi:YggS family pyridoxal phosphate-dependent enzyme [Paracrocinitomix mangrovi]|uniref:YggS family pyridoxal phosphate-dependent enzyme n=1 Tax=Paracrocinitomix mangrovi TaxID=2862509 RepID=UPI001C8E41AD|nr:YggS family pyridoxal phosphate-dependent enzyme [Paracrocinitomix mangrovi]UKN02633.1 YggS family pyridoxal phosphate-dependent enzyme [Paracrocinitomix mangrovi]
MIKDNLLQIKDNLPEEVQLIAVSKTKPIEMIQEAYDAGQRAFGENRALELADKFEKLPKDIEWHMIGHLQRNKVKYIAPFVHLIHGIDSPRLLAEVNKQAEKFNRVQKVLLQFHIAQESSKFGFSLEEAIEYLNGDEFNSMQNVEVCGVMGMATFTSDTRQVREEFHDLKKIFDHLKTKHFSDATEFTTISMGMSGDYEIAISEGSTMVRVGSAIFGSRN